MCLLDQDWCTPVTSTETQSRRHKETGKYRTRRVLILLSVQLQCSGMCQIISVWSSLMVLADLCCVNLFLNLPVLWSAWYTVSTTYTKEKEVWKNNAQSFNWSVVSNGVIPVPYSTLPWHSEWHITEKLPISYVMDSELCIIFMGFPVN